MRRGASPLDGSSVPATAPCVLGTVLNCFESGWIKSSQPTGRPMHGQSKAMMNDNDPITFAVGGRCGTAAIPSCSFCFWFSCRVLYLAVFVAFAPRHLGSCFFGGILRASKAGCRETTQPSGRGRRCGHRQGRSTAAAGAVPTSPPMINRRVIPGVRLWTGNRPCRPVRHIRNRTV
jgi:hypothetical protein